ncbi:hypothetical protein [Phenylobacterium sp.]|uniref:hypothetical protein n=1 Tax=Phenylobacterium sp. TaxID=1871053 RepID=UPI0030F43F6B
MSQDGYTLTETLAALVMIGLAIGGLSLGVHVLGRSQLAVSRQVAAATAARIAQVDLERMLASAGAFRARDAGGLVGKAEAFDFACGAASRCKAALRDTAKGFSLDIQTGQGDRHLALGPAAGARFVYRGTLADSPVWPPAGTTHEALRAVSIIEGDGATVRPILVARAWAEQPAACDFDVVMQDCR